jgi:hypothetical protein
MMKVFSCWGEAQAGEEKAAAQERGAARGVRLGAGAARGGRGRGIGRGRRGRELAGARRVRAATARRLAGLETGTGRALLWGSRRLTGDGTGGRQQRSQAGGCAGAGGGGRRRGVGSQASAGDQAACSRRGHLAVLSGTQVSEAAPRTQRGAAMGDAAGCS